jgi:hypothetical protein
VTRAAAGGELRLEGGYLGAEDVPAALEDADDRVVKRWLETLVLRFEIE